MKSFEHSGFFTRNNKHHRTHATKRLLSAWSVHWIFLWAKLYIPRKKYFGHYNHAARILYAGITDALSFTKLAFQISYLCVCTIYVALPFWQKNHTIFQQLSIFFFFLNWLHMKDMDIVGRTFRKCRWFACTTTTGSKWCYAHVTCACMHIYELNNFWKMVKWDKGEFTAGVCYHPFPLRRYNHHVRSNKVKE